MRLSRCPAFIPTIDRLEDRTSPAVWGLDLTLGESGVAGPPNNKVAKYFYDVAALPDGGIVAVGQSAIFTGATEFTVLKFTSDGRPDPTFDGDGARPIPFEGPVSTDSPTTLSRPEARAVAVLPDGDILAAGNTNVQNGLTSEGLPAYDSAIGVVRLNSDGSYDTAFGTTGRTRIGLPASIDGTGNVAQKVSKVVVQPDGHILIAASILQSNGVQGGLVSPVVVRLNADGSRDDSFGTNGVVILPVTPAVRQEFFAGKSQAYRFPEEGDSPDLDLTADGRIVVTDRSRWQDPPSESTATYFSVVRLNVDGSRDTTFDGDGIKTVAFQTRAKGSVLYDTGEAVVTPDGKVTIAGIAYPDGSPTQKLQTGFIRLNPDGSLDATVNKTGIRLTPNPQHFSGQGTAAGPNGTVYVFGVSYDSDPAANPGMASFPLAVRLRADGTLDSSFDRDGNFAAIGPNTNEVFGGTVAPDGRLLIIGDTFRFDEDVFGNKTPVIAPFIIRAEPKGETGTVQFAADAVSVNEADGKAVLTVTRTGGSLGDITVDVMTAGGTATGADFSVASPATLFWASGDTAPKTITVPIIDDGVTEGPETFTITIRPELPDDIGSPDKVTVTITDSPGTVRFLAPTAIVAEGDSTTLIVVRENGRSGRLVVDYDSTRVIIGQLDESAAAGTDYELLRGTLVWEDGDDTPREITFRSLPDDVAERTERAVVSLFGTGVNLGDPQDAVVSITDSPGRLEFEPTVYEVGEADGEVVVTVRRVGGAGGSVTARYETGDITATAGQDYERTAGELFWNDFDTGPKSFRIPLLGDALAEGPESFLVRLTGSSGGASLDPEPATVLIQDNDALPGVVFAPVNGYNVRENDGQVVVRLRLIGASSTTVTATYTTIDGDAREPGDYTKTVGTVSWAAGESGERVVIVPITDDNTFENREGFAFQIVTVTGGATGAGGIAQIFIDDDQMGPVIVPPVVPPAVPPVPPGVPPAIPPSVPPSTPPTVPPSGPRANLVGMPQTAVGGGSGVQFLNPDRTVRASVTPFVNSSAQVRTAAADFNQDGVADIVAGTGPGGSSGIRVLDGVTQRELFTIAPFEASFTGGVYVAAGDVNGDGMADLVVTPDEGGGPRVDVYSGNGFGKLMSFFGIDDTSFRGGARASTGDINGDGTADLLVVAGFGGGPRVAGFDGRELAGGRFVKLFADFFAFEQGLRNGVFVAAGDIDGDGYAELIAGGGPGGGPRVLAFSGKSLLSNQYDVRANFFGGDANSRGGIRVAVKDLDGDARADVVVGSGTGAGGRVTAYLGKSVGASGPPPVAFEFDVPNADGVFVG